ncbi:MAG TPA: P1 family peptidase [Acidimicrobiales bacterium]|nr:P1 family peptidase [Acidimicrobiales bacterium]
MADEGASRGSGRVVRAADLGIRIGTGRPGPHNAITDVAGVRVGHTTLIAGDGPLVVGSGPVRTGVTVVVPGDGVGRAQYFAGCHRLNGNGELTGLEWIRESGLLTSPIALTNTHSVGVVRDALVAAEVRSRPREEAYWSLPVVGETWDGMLNDVNGFHVRAEHLFAALDGARPGPVAEGGVGGGTGMICHEFKGGIGTASRVVADAAGGWTVGVLVQANYGERQRLTVDGVPVGREIPISEVPAPEAPPGEVTLPAGSGSIIAVVATDAPLLPHQCRRLAQRAGLGVARVGGVGAHSSGDLFVAFATGNAGDVYPGGPESVEGPLSRSVTMLADPWTSPLSEAVVDATEEAILNALVAGATMTGRDGITAHALPHDRVREVLAAHGRR